MKESPEEQARREARNAIRYAHLATEMACLLAADMQAQGALRPSTKSKLLDALREMDDLGRTQFALSRLRQSLGEPAPLEREMKRETPKDRG